MRLSAFGMLPVVLAVVLIMPVGCAPPTVALGASISFGTGRAGGAAGTAQASVRNALWIALECSAPAATTADRNALAELAEAKAIQRDDRNAPCSLEAACDWEHAAAQAAWLEQSSTSEEEERELTP